MSLLLTIWKDYDHNNLAAWVAVVFRVSAPAVMEMHRRMPEEIASSNDPTSPNIQIRLTDCSWVWREPLLLLGAVQASLVSKALWQFWLKPDFRFGHRIRLCRTQKSRVLIIPTLQYQIEVHALWYIRVSDTIPVLKLKGFLSTFEYSVPLHPPLTPIIQYWGTLMRANFPVLNTLSTPENF